MIGRAGRPQFDREGVAVVMTEEGTVQHWENVMSGQKPLESNLLPKIIDHMNAEVVVNTMVRECICKVVAVDTHWHMPVQNDPAQAIRWFKSTFCFMRMKVRVWVGVDAGRRGCG